MLNKMLNFIQVSLIKSGLTISINCRQLTYATFNTQSFSILIQLIPSAKIPKPYMRDAGYWHISFSLITLLTSQ